MDLARLLLHPATRSLELDDPRTTTRRRGILRDRDFLRALYREWYRRLARALPAGDGPVVELGSGAGFLAEVLSGVLTSEILPVPQVRALLDGCALPFRDRSLRAIVMTNVLHHLPDVRSFLREAQRTLRPGGTVAAVEPWPTRWSRFVYRRLNHEPFDPDAAGWEMPASRPLSGANGALPWIVFGRDRSAFAAGFPRLRLRLVEPLMPVSYLLSGGFTAFCGLPGWAYGPWRRIESAIPALERRLAMFSLIVLECDGSGPTFARGPEAGDPEAGRPTGGSA